MANLRIMQELRRAAGLQPDAYVPEFPLKAISLRQLGTPAARVISRG
jgi:hypothetical protein